MKLILAVCGLFVAHCAYAQPFAECRALFAGQTPPKLNKPIQLTRDLCYADFAVLHSGQSKTPVYVVERLNRASLEEAKHEQRTNRFFADARLPAAERAELEDYKGSGYDRGHQAPAGDRSTPEAMAQSFSLANMVPQAPENNRHAWADIEKATRKYVMRAQGDVFVYTGPVYYAPVQTIGRGKVWVPSALFKLVYDPATGRSWAHWLENTNEAQPSQPISYAELVRRTGIVFLNK